MGFPPSPCSSLWEIFKVREPTNFSGTLIFINFSRNLSFGFLIFIYILVPKIAKKYNFSPFLPKTPKKFPPAAGFYFSAFSKIENFRCFYFYQLFSEFDSGSFIDGGFLFLISRYNDLY